MRLLKFIQKNNVELLLLNILESVKVYPHEYLFINNRGEQYTEKGLQKMLFELVPEKNIGIKALLSIYTSHNYPKLTKNKLNRVEFLMHTTKAPRDRKQYLNEYYETKK